MLSRFVDNSVKNDLRKILFKRSNRSCLLRHNYATYSYGHSPNFGNKIEAHFLKSNPYAILWPFEGSQFYTLLLVGNIALKHMFVIK
nr:PREDICTED: uncharacterized protein LOC109041710 isoform X2 [Bemisia tabaci]